MRILNYINMDINSIDGYPVKIFNETPEEKYLCHVGNHVLRDPIQTSCGHRYCSQCFHQLTSSMQVEPAIVYCKGCRNEGYDSILSKNEIYPDRAIARELQGKTVECINKNECDWLGLLKEYDEHFDTCVHARITCIHKNGCGALIKRSELSEHLENNCPMRMTSCKYCSEQLPFKELKNHNTICEQYPMQCQQCKKGKMSRSELKKHQDPESGDCAKKLVHCSFKSVGCNELLASDTLCEHDRTSVDVHQHMLLKTYISFSTEIEGITKDRESLQTLTIQQAGLEKTTEHLLQNTRKLEESLRKCNAEKSTGSTNGIKHLEGALERYSKKTEELKNKQSVLDTKVSTYEGIIAVLNSQIERDALAVQNVERQRRQDRDTVESLERKLKAQDRILALKDVALAEQDLRIQSLELASYDGIMVWKIPDFRRHRQGAISGKTTSVYSHCFFTSRHGYKMCARIYLNGDGMGKGNHLSLFFVIMRGPNDALLRWPFRQKVTFMWLDQNNREHVIDAFRPDPTSSSFQRPTQDMNVASGCPLFMPINQLDSPRHAYVKDDVAFLKIIVDTTDLG